MINILFATSVGNAKSYDYLTDGIFHGLKTRPEKFSVYECFAMKHLYKDLPTEDGPSLFGRRNISGNPNELSLRECLQMISDSFFDVIVFDWRTSSSFWQSHGHCPYFSETMAIRDAAFAAYSKDKIVFLDSADDPVGKYPEFVKEFLGKSTYFKRELYNDDPYFHPIDIPFAAECTQPLTTSAGKERYLATVVPDQKHTYVFKDAESYYGDYRTSYFGATWKKIGWGCYRHSEIVFSSCIPLFPDIADCPDRTLTFFPKKIFKQVLDRGILSQRTIKVQKYYDMYCYENVEINEKAVDKSWYDDTLRTVYEHAHRNLSTIAMSDYVLSKLNI